MRVLYIDSLFWLELSADALLLWAAGKLCMARRSFVRLGLAALIGAVYAVLSVFVSAAAALPGKAASLALMLLAAYGGERNIWRICITYLFLCALYAGISTAVILSAGRVTARALLFSAGVSLGVCELPFRFAGRRGGKSRLRLVGEGGETELNALRDNGDHLSDPFSGRPVVIAGEKDLAILFQEDVRKKLKETEGLPPEERLPLLGKGFCLLPVSTVSGSAIALSGTVREAYADGRPLGPCRVAFSREELRTDGCTALISADIG